MLSSSHHQRRKFKNLELACRLGAKRAFGRSSFRPNAPIARLLLEEEETNVLEKMCKVLDRASGWP